MFVHVRISDLLFFDLDEFLAVLSALQLPLPTISSSASSTLGVDSDNPIVFNIEVSGAATLLKPWMKRW